MTRTISLAAFLLGSALAACQSSPPPPEPWMPTGAEAQVISADEAAAEARATIRDDNADAVYQELLADTAND